MVWAKGESGNPAGRPKSSAIEELRRALENVENAKGKSFVQHFIEKSYMSPQMAIALMKKLYPDMVHLEAGGDAVERFDEVLGRVKAKDAEPQPGRSEIVDTGDLQEPA